MSILWEVGNMNNFYVYVWIRKDIDKVFYVGKGKNNRYKDLSSRNKWFLNVVHKVVIENIEIKILEKNLDEETAFQKEKEYIQTYRNQNHPLVNLTDGGEGSSNWYEFLSDEEKEHHREISKSFLNKHHSDETKEKMRKAALGRKWDDEHKKLFSEQAKQRKNSYWKGKHLSEEAKEKIRKARTNNPTYGKPVYKLNKDFEIIKEFKSRTECMREEKTNLITEWNIRNAIEQNSTKTESFIFINNFIYIYKQSYELSKPQSTIENLVKE